MFLSSVIDFQAPLPTNWKPCKSADTGEIYYFNFETAESTWDHPCDGYYKRLYEEEKKKKETTKKVYRTTITAVNALLKILNVCRLKVIPFVQKLVKMLISCQARMGRRKSSLQAKNRSNGKVMLPQPDQPSPLLRSTKKRFLGLEERYPLDGYYIIKLVILILFVCSTQSPLPDSIPLRTTQSVFCEYFEVDSTVFDCLYIIQRDSTPERGRGEKKYSSATSSRPASADAKLGGGGGRALASLSSVPLPATVPAVAGDPPSSPEFTDSDVSPVKSESKGAVERSDEKNYGAKAERKSKNSRIHSAVASSSDFGSPELK